MKELLDKLLAADILTEESKAEITTALNEHLSVIQEQAKADAVATVTAELHEQWISERELLIEALDQRVTEMLTVEMAELRTDISNFRDLEAEYATKFVEHKASLAEQFQSDMANLIEKLDEFVEIRLQAEMDELKTELTEARKVQLGRTIFEAFAAEYAEFHIDDDSVAATLAATERQLKSVNEAFEQVEKRAAAAERQIEMNRVLAPLSGHPREVMEAILSRIDTPLLAESYQAYVSRVINPSAPSEKETTVLAEGSKPTDEIVGVAVTGDDVERLKADKARAKLAESANTVSPSGMSTEERARMRKLAGITE